MIQVSKNRLGELFGKFETQKIMVVGDLMLDRYLWGEVTKISPEAPVPVVDIQSEECRFGGAANVCLNVTTLGAHVIPVGIIGSDNSGEILQGLFKSRNLSVDGLIVDSDRPTTVKTRIIAHDQHVVRTDREIRAPISRGIQDRLMDFIHACLDDVDAVIMEDYNKGLLVPDLIHAIISSVNAKGKIVLVDPKFDHFFDFQNVTLFKPNRKEVADKMGIRLDSDEALEMSGQKLMERLRCQALLITLGKDGMALFEKGEQWIKVPTRAVKVHDVSGAGDTVIATLAVSMTAGGDLKEAATIANHAAGYVCGEVGIVPIEKETLLNVMMSS